jgi:hypothetical protein
MTRPKARASRPRRAKELPPLGRPLGARQQREVLRYAANFGVDAAAVLREVEASISPAVERAVAALAEASDAYERAKAASDDALRAQFRRVEAGPRTPLRAADPPAPAGAAGDDRVNAGRAGAAT